jgi:hypothetical protein
MSSPPAGPGARLRPLVRLRALTPGGTSRLDAGELPPVTAGSAGCTPPRLARRSRFQSTTPRHSLPVPNPRQPLKRRPPRPSLPATNRSTHLADCACRETAHPRMRIRRARASAHGLPHPRYHSAHERFQCALWRLSWLSFARAARAGGHAVSVARVLKIGQRQGAAALVRRRIRRASSTSTRGAGSSSTSLRCTAPAAAVNASISAVRLAST